MKDSKNEVLNKATDENVVAGVLDGASLTDDILDEVNGGKHHHHRGDDTGCSH